MSWERGRLAREFWGAAFTPLQRARRNRVVNFQPVFIADVEAG
jgi:hypothetical protein